MGRKNTAISRPIYQIKVTLMGSRPPVWRRIQVPGDATLAQLHDVLQMVMGWQDYHLHLFSVGRTLYGLTDPELGIPEERDERWVTLRQVAPGQGSTFTYEYDFGDGWRHDVRVEKILSPEAGVRYPRCTQGRRACPPEDVGALPGYYDFLEAIEDPEHPEHEGMLEWIGGAFDPDAFDVEAVNAELLVLM